MKNEKYTYRVTWSEEDGEYVGQCLEFPALSWLARTQEAALRGIRAVVAESVDDMLAQGEAIPEPIATRSYSGRFLVRVPPEIHRMLVMEAAESGVSLNRLVSARLGRYNQGTADR
ncbi:MAG: type II toxin-antitoxin system HicB family antitoxin [Bacteroidia bacterium]|nr:type II toxin-antitoxin system HicB family antitoxin [Bacteroidia bacterium]